MVRPLGINPGAVVAQNGDVTAIANGGGILVNPGTTSTISNAGTISVVDNYTVGVVGTTTTAAGPIANTTGRYGILVNGAATGSITNSGGISVKGLGAVGIGLNGTYTGTVTNTGTIVVRGDNAIGISTQAFTGDLVVGGSVGVAGQGAQAIVTGGNIGGKLLIQGGVLQSAGYTTDSNTSQTLSAAALRTGKAAVEVNGNVAGGIAIYAPCNVTTVSSVNSCTSTGTATTTGAITAIGSSPGLQIGGANNIVIGGSAASVDGSTYSLAIDGTVAANATNTATDAFGVVIGGRGGTVSMPRGIGVTGTVTATTVDSNATAVLINAGSTVASMTNSGAIRATSTQAPASTSAIYGVRDLSGTLTSFTNHGGIGTTGGTTNTAIDLSVNTSGVTVTQSLSAYQKAQQDAEKAASGYNPATATVYNAIAGDIRTGSGNDTIAIKSGTVTGNAYLGGGTDTVALSGDGRWTGDLNFGTGSATITLADSSKFTGALALGGQPATLTIGGTSAFRGSAITGGSQLAVVVNGGSFGASQAATLSVNSLTVNAAGTLNAYIDGTAGTSSLIQATTATFATGSKLSATISALAHATGVYKVLSAGTLTGSPTFSTADTVLPVLFKGSLAVQANELFLTIARKSAAELGLTSAQASGYDAIYANAANNANLGASLLQVADTAALQGQFNALLPDHGGGVFEFVTRGNRLVARHLTDDSAMYDISDVAGWLEPIYFKGSKYATGTAAWNNNGFGISAGLERKSGIGNVGISLAYFGGKVNDGTWQNIKTKAFEFGAFWRVSKGPLYAFARISGDRLTAKSTRTFIGAVNGATLGYVSTGRWNGWAVSGNAGASYKLALPGNFTLKPMAILEYTRLTEKGYAETGAAPIDLTVNSRTSRAFTATTTLTAGWSNGPSSRDERPLTIEVEGGRRNKLSGQLGATTASSAGGNPFTITPDELKGGWIGEARVLTGGFDYTLLFAANAQQTFGKTDLGFRASISMAF